MQRTSALFAVIAAAGLVSACETTSGLRDSAGETASNIGSGVSNRASAIGAWFTSRGSEDGSDVASTGYRRGATARTASTSSESLLSRQELEARLTASEERVAALSEQLAATSGTSSTTTLAAPAPVETSLLGGPDDAPRTAVAAPSVEGVGGGGIASDYPPDAAPGQCFARVLTPPRTRVITETVPAAPQSSEIEVVPARFEIREERVLVEPVRTVTEVLPETYRTVTERVLIEPQRTELVSLPAEYREVSEEVMVRPAYVTWKRGEGLFGSDEVDETRILPTGEVMCRVTVPAEYRTVTRRELVREARTEERVIPARYDTVPKQVLDQPSRIIERVLPAVYETVQRREQVAPPRTETIVRPASTQTVERVEVVEEPRLEWREVLCRTNATRGTIAQVQRALAREGFRPGPVDGVFGPQTLRAMENFQRARSIAVGQLTRETVEELGLPFEPRADI